MGCESSPKVLHTFRPLELNQQIDILLPWMTPKRISKWYQFDRIILKLVYWWKNSCTCWYKYTYVCLQYIYIDMIIYIYTCPKWKNSETKGTNYRYQFGAGLNVPYLWLGSGAFLAQQFSVVMVGSMASDARFRIGNSFPRSWQGKTTKISCAAGVLQSFHRWRINPSTVYYRKFHCCSPSLRFNCCTNIILLYPSHGMVGWWQKSVFTILGMTPLRWDT